MASPTQHETTTFTSPPPESSVKDFATAINTTTDTVVEPVAEHTVEPSAAAVAALQDLAKGIGQSEEIDLTAELPQDSGYPITSIGDDIVGNATEPPPNSATRNS